MNSHLHNEQIIDRLLKLWYSLIGQDHHKDRDCWFFIEREYCTYQQPSWTVRHNGYILKDFNEQFDSFEKAQQGLIEFLIESCAQEINTISTSEDTNENTQNLVESKLKELERIVTDQYYIAEKL